MRLVFKVLMSRKSYCATLNVKGEARVADGGI